MVDIFSFYVTIIIGDGKMKELIDVKNNMKMMAMILGGICYDNQEYLLYSISRSKEEANIFISRLIKTSSGYVIDYQFDNGEKEVLDKVVHRVLNREPIEVLEKEGFVFIKDIELSSDNYFDVDICYVATVSKKMVKDFLIYYDLVNEDVLKDTTVLVRDDKKILNKGAFGNILFIILGISIIVFCISIVYSIFIK